MQSLQLEVVISVIAIFILSALLAGLLTKKCIQKKSIPHLYWSIGMWLFAFGVFLEVLFALNVYSEFLISLYLFAVAALVLSLSIGALLLLQKRWLNRIYYAFSIISLAALMYALVTFNIGNILTNYVVFGPLPLAVIITSTVITFPAAAVLIIVAALSYKRNHRMIGIIAGTLIVSVAGTLYITSFPEFLYYSEFIGILLLWLAFI